MRDPARPLVKLVCGLAAKTIDSAVIRRLFAARAVCPSDKQSCSNGIGHYDRGVQPDDLRDRCGSSGPCAGKIQIDHEQCNRDGKAEKKKGGRPLEWPTLFQRALDQKGREQDHDQRKGHIATEREGKMVPPRSLEGHDRTKDQRERRAPQQKPEARTPPGRIRLPAGSSQLQPPFGFIEGVIFMLNLVLSAIPETP